MGKTMGKFPKINIKQYFILNIPFHAHKSITDRLRLCSVKFMLYRENCEFSLPEIKEKEEN